MTTMGMDEDVLNEIDDVLDEYNAEETEGNFDDLFYLEGNVITSMPFGNTYDLGNSKDRDAFLNDLKPYQNGLRFALNDLLDDLDE